ncbi:hypothetical protein Agub_g7498 [Astrephomene gubernaculifera]|uniref:non-specific serine/threonine protein kinase n=1 Tax=Astrephomene gubernaculifera TaxID=47775 RepID=A0AAD3HLT0_9CHLO|nr:hypothetical protein Agub_g7498 [Astrephomene gubernaculifera]
MLRECTNRGVPAVVKTFQRKQKQPAKDDPAKAAGVERDLLACTDNIANTSTADHVVASRSKRPSAICRPNANGLATNAPKDARGPSWLRKGLNQKRCSVFIQSAPMPFAAKLDATLTRGRRETAKQRAERLRIVEIMMARAAEVDAFDLVVESPGASPDPPKRTSKQHHHHHRIGILPGLEGARNLAQLGINRRGLGAVGNAGCIEVPKLAVHERIDEEESDSGGAVAGGGAPSVRGVQRTESGLGDTGPSGSQGDNGAGPSLEALLHHVSELRVSAACSSAWSQPQPHLRPQPSRQAPKQQQRQGSDAEVGLDPHRHRASQPASSPSASMQSCQEPRHQQQQRTGHAASEVASPHQSPSVLQWQHPQEEEQGSEEAAGTPPAQGDDVRMALRSPLAPSPMQQTPLATPLPASQRFAALREDDMDVAATPVSLAARTGLLAATPVSLAARTELGTAATPAAATAPPAADPVSDQEASPSSAALAVSFGGACSMLSPAVMHDHRASDADAEEEGMLDAVVEEEEEEVDEGRGQGQEAAGNAHANRAEVQEEPQRQRGKQPQAREAVAQEGQLGSSRRVRKAVVATPGSLPRARTRARTRAAAAPAVGGAASAGTAGGAAAAAEAAPVEPAPMPPAPQVTMDKAAAGVAPHLAAASAAAAAATAPDAGDLPAKVVTEGPGAGCKRASRKARTNTAAAEAAAAVAGAAVPATAVAAAAAVPAVPDQAAASEMIAVETSAGAALDAAEAPAAASAAMEGVDECAVQQGAATLSVEVSEVEKEKAEASGPGPAAAAAAAGGADWASLEGLTDLQRLLVLCGQQPHTSPAQLPSMDLLLARLGAQLAAEGGEAAGGGLAANFSLGLDTAAMGSSTSASGAAAAATAAPQQAAGRSSRGKQHCAGASVPPGPPIRVVKVGEGSYGEAFRLELEDAVGGGGKGGGAGAAAAAGGGGRGAKGGRGGAKGGGRGAAGRAAASGAAGECGAHASCSSSSRGGVVLKVVPIEGDMHFNGGPQRTAADMLSETLMCRELSNLGELRRPGSCSGGGEAEAVHWTPGFVRTWAMAVCRGPYSKQLVQAWKSWDATHGSENDCVSRLPPQQLYWVIAMEDSGTDLEEYPLTSWEQLRSVMLQVGLALAVAEAALAFEHRDLHWGNVLVRPTGHQPATHAARGSNGGEDSSTSSDWVEAGRLGGCSLRVRHCGVAATIIDFTQSRLTTPPACGVGPQGGSGGGGGGVTAYCDMERDPEVFQGKKGHVQFDTYRCMRALVGSDWSVSCPATNCLWMSYLAEVLAQRGGGGGSAVGAAEAAAAVAAGGVRLGVAQRRQLREFRTRAVQYSDCGELIRDPLFQDLLLLEEGQPQGADE